MRAWECVCWRKRFAFPSCSHLKWEMALPLVGARHQFGCVICSNFLLMHSRNGATVGAVCSLMCSRGRAVHVEHIKRIKRIKRAEHSVRWALRAGCVSLLTLDKSAAFAAAVAVTVIVVLAAVPWQRNLLPVSAFSIICEICCIHYARVIWWSYHPES